jgi:hypothetical protein
MGLRRPLKLFILTLAAILFLCAPLGGDRNKLRYIPSYFYRNHEAPLPNIAQDIYNGTLGVG